MTFNLDDSSPLPSPIGAQDTFVTEEDFNMGFETFEGDTEILKEEMIHEEVSEMDPTKDLVTVGKFDDIMIWTSDRVPLDRGEDVYVRTLIEWIELSGLIHAR